MSQDTSLAENVDTQLSLQRQIAERILRYVLHPPSPDSPVIEYGSPDELLAAFDATVGMSLAGKVSPAAEPDLLAAAELVLSRSVHTTHPRFLNQNFAGPDALAVIGDWMAAALNTTNATFEAAPVFTLMERSVIAKLATIAGYPVRDGAEDLPLGMFCPGGSTATLYALQLARHRHNPDLIRTGAGPEKLVLFVSRAAHYASLKSAALLGLGMDAVIEVETTAGGAMVPEGLRRAVQQARDDGATPFAVVATAGTTVTSAFDPLDAVADVCEEEKLWLHVDGCWGGSALFSAQHRELMSGIERSDSFVWNLHKMMGMTQQCSVLLVKDPDQLAPVFSSKANYIFQPDKAFGEFDAGDRTFQCGRRVDVLKLWLCWKLEGDDGFAQRIDHAVSLADHARHRIAESEGAFLALVEGDFTNVCFLWVPPELRPLSSEQLHADPATRDRLHRLAPQIKARMQAEGTAMVGFQPVHEVNAFRLLFMNPRVTSADVDAVLDLIAAYGVDAWE